MIKNIVFDMGRVLLYWDQDYFMDRCGVPEEDREILLREMYRSVEWVQMDRGILDEEQAIALWNKRVPGRLREAVRKLSSEWDRPIIPIEGMAKLIRELKDKGYGIYLISNASRRQHEYWPGVPGHECFDDTLISADIGINKPEPEIFREAYRRFGIKAEESLFVDDMPANCEAAILTGMDAFVFWQDVTSLRVWLNDRGVTVEI